MEIMVAAGCRAPAQRCDAWNREFPRYWQRLGAIFAVSVGFLGVGEAQTIQYSIGDPSAEEQLSLELINRARANPAAEGERLAAQALAEASVYSDVYSFGTSLAVMKAEMAGIAPTPPLSFNENLIAVARTHNDNMLASNVQTHYAKGSALHYEQRMDNSGYVWSWAGENIFASALNVEEAHASFEIDWGSGPGGMQSPRGHRAAIHHPEYREIGIGYLIASSSNLGPALITQDFGERISRATIKPYITGVAIYDADGDGFYDIGEGIGGVRVEVIRLSTGQHEDHYAITAASGGYSVPVDGGAGDYQVNFLMPGGGIVSETVSVVSEWHTEFNPDWERGFNKKLDLVLQAGDSPGYTPSQIITAPAIGVGVAATIEFSALVGAQEYEVLVAESVASPAEQDAEAGAPVTAVKSPSYSLVATPSNQGDRLAFHLAHPSSAAGSQSMTLERVFVPGPAAQIQFASRLRRAGTAQLAVLQATPDWGRTWEDLWLQQSNFSNADGFTPVAVDVSRFAGQPLQFRFVFYLGGGSVEYGVGPERGWHIDDIGFVDMSELLSPVRTKVGASEFQFPPSPAGSYHLQVRARAGADFLRYSPASLLEVGADGYAAWVARREAMAGLGAGALADSTADYDGDGLSQLIEYALEATGLDPARPDSERMPGAEIEGAELCVHYFVDNSLSDVSVAVEVSMDLENWYLPGSVGAPAGFVDRTLGAPLGSLQERVASIPLGSYQAAFMRVRVEQLSPGS